MYALGAPHMFYVAVPLDVYSLYNLSASYSSCFVLANPSKQSRRSKLNQDFEMLLQKNVLRLGLFLKRLSCVEWLN